MNDADLVLAQCSRDLSSAVGARKAARWRKVSRAILSDLVGSNAAPGDGAQEDDDGEDED